MVPFGILLANAHGAEPSLQFLEPHYHAWEDSPCSPAKSRLGARDFSTVPIENFMIRDLYNEDDRQDEYDCGLPPITRESNFSLDMDDCERGFSSPPMSLPLSSLTADEASDGKQSLPITARSRVAFSKQVECFQIDTLDSYSDEEYDSMWYSPEESQAIRIECAKTLQVMLGDVPLDELDICFRGLECKAGHTLEARQTRKTILRHSVLDEQAVNRDLKVDNPEALAAFSQQHSAPSVAAAIETAQRDHTQDCDQWMYHFDEDEWTYTNEIIKPVSWLHAALPIAPKLCYFKMLRNPHRAFITA